MGLRKDGTYLQFKDAPAETVLGWDGANHPYHMGVFTPATALANGSVGLVPKPLSGQQEFVLSNNGWIPASAVGGITVGSGLNNTGGVVKLGGLLTEAVNIDGGFNFMIGDSTRVSFFRARSTGGFDLNNDGTVSGNSTITNSIGSLKIKADSGGASSTNYSAGIDFQHTVPTILYRVSPNAANNSIDRVVTFRRGPATVGGTTGLGMSLGLSLRNSGGTYKESDGIKYLFTDATNAAEHTKYTFNLLVTGTDTEIVDLDRYGFVYKANYSANWTDRHLVDKGWVISQIALGGGALVNTAAVNEIPKSGSAVTIIPSGIFSTAIGSISLGTGLAGTSRYVAADGSASDVGLKLYTKGAGIMDFAFGNGGATIGDIAINGSRVLTVGSNSASADLVIYSKGASSAITLGNTSATASSFRFDGSTATLSLQKSPTAGATTFDIVGSNGINATFTHGDSLRIKAGDGYDPSGNGQGGSVTVQAGIKRAGGSGVDGAIILAFRDGILNIGDPNVVGNRLVQVGSGDTNASLTIRPKGTGALNLGLSSATINFVGTIFQLNGAAGTTGQFMRFDGTWATPSTGTPFSNTAAANEIPISASSTSIAPSGIFSYAHGDLLLGTDIAANRNIYADGSSATVDLRLWPKGTSGKIMLGVTTGGLIVGATNVVGDRTLLCGSSDANASLYIQTAGTGTLHLGYTTNTVNIVGATLKVNNAAGAAGQFLRYDMTWATPAGGVSNTAAANELMKSVSGNAAPSGLFSTANGNITLGSSSISGSRVIDVASSDTHAGITFQNKGTTASMAFTNALTYQFYCSPGMIYIDAGVNKIKNTIAHPSFLPFAFEAGPGDPTTIHGQSFTFTAGDAYSVSGNGNGGSISIIPGIKRSAGSGTDGNINLSTINGTIFLGSSSAAGDRVVSVGSSATNAALTIKQKGVGALNLGLDTGPAYLKGSTVTIEQTNLEIGAVWIAGDRTIYAKSATGNSSLYIMPQSGGHIVLGVGTGAVYIGDTTLTGNRFINTGTSSTNADLTINQQGLGSLNVGNDTGTLDFRGASIEIRGLVGSAGQFFRYDGVWALPGVPWTNFDTGVSPTGFASYAVKTVRYQYDGTCVRMLVGIEGASNGTGFTFALPYTPNAIYGTNGIRLPAYTINNTTTGLGRILISGSSAVCTVESGIGGGAWANTGTKACFCEFTYQI